MPPGTASALIDPHGDLAEELLDCIPPHRADDLVYFNPGDLDFPIGLNLIANVAPDDRHLVASGIVGAFKSIWRDSWGPRLEYILYNAIAALLDCPNTSLLGVNRMLTDADYRRRIVAKVRDPFVRAFWTDEYEQYDTRFQREAIAPIQNKLGQFLLNPVVRNILGQVRTKVSIPFMMNTGRIFIANLSKGKLGADKANLLGSLLTTQFQLGAMARVNQPENERRDFFLFLDEFHNFTTDAFTSILSEARKYRLCLALAHQYIEQVPLPVRSAVFGNVGSLISFRVGNADAEVLQREFGKTYALETFVGLDRFEVIARLSDDGQTREAFRAQTLPPSSTTSADVKNSSPSHAKNMPPSARTLRRRLNDGSPAKTTIRAEFGRVGFHFCPCGFEVARYAEMVNCGLDSDDSSPSFSLAPFNWWRDPQHHRATLAGTRPHPRYFIGVATVFRPDCGYACAAGLSCPRPNFDSECGCKRLRLNRSGYENKHANAKQLPMLRRKRGDAGIR